LEEVIRLEEEGEIGQTQLDIAAAILSDAAGGVGQILAGVAKADMLEQTGEADEVGLGNVHGNAAPVEMNRVVVATGD
jgi:hypothetical protein